MRPFRDRPFRGGLSRRAVLGGAAAAVSLPFLEAMLPLRRARADQGAGVPRRAIFYFVPNGMPMPAWEVAPGEGAGFALSSVLAPLDGLQDRLLVLRGLANRSAIATVAGDHARGTGSFLTCRPVNKSEGDDIENGISVDQALAPALCPGSLFPSMQLGIDGGGSVGACDSGYSCAYSRNISWAGPTTPLAKLTNPAVVFDRMFAGYDAALTEEERARRARTRASVLDAVLDDAAVLRGTLSSRDRAKLDEHLDGVRELERRLQDAGPSPSCVAGPRPEEDGGFLPTVDAMTELMALALSCDMTRVVSFMLGNGASYRSFSFLGIGGAHHELSHHQDDPAKIAALETIAAWEVDRLGALLRRLDSVEEADGGSLLDHTLVLFSSEVADGDAHAHVDLPVLLAGGFGGAVRGGRCVQMAERPLADLYLGILRAAGLPDTTFGADGVAPLELT